ncbi:FecR family protein [Spirosoma daeguense]
MDHYRTYTAEELAQDDFFRQWVQAPTAENDTFWSGFQMQYPECRSAVIKARAFLKAVENTQILPTATQRDRMWTDIQQQIQNGEIVDVVNSPRIRRIGFWQSWGAAAAVLLLLGFGWWFVQKPDSADQLATSAGWHSPENATLTEKRNETQKPLTVQLSDGSTIVLQPRSRVQYPEKFNSIKREVYLEGEGFFEVTKNPDQPFIVYANGLVTQVVGTSFTIKAMLNVAQVSVAVRTGKVAVYTLKALQQSQQRSGTIANRLLLTPNQQAIFNTTNEQLTKRLVDEPALLNKPETSQYFVFDEAPVSDVFQKLEQAYGVTIQYDSTTFSGCSLTAPLGNEPLFRKLDIVCQTIGATYEVWGTRVVIRGVGCRTN